MRKIIDMILGGIPNSLKDEGLVVDNTNTVGEITTITRSFVSKDGITKKSITITVPTIFIEEKTKEETVDRSDEQKINILLDLLNEYDAVEKKAAAEADYNKAIEFRSKKDKVKVEIAKIKNQNTGPGS